jgi:hypothetical protein
MPVTFNRARNYKGRNELKTKRRQAMWFRKSAICSFKRENGRKLTGDEMTDVRIEANRRAGIKQQMI